MKNHDEQWKPRPQDFMVDLQTGKLRRIVRRGEPAPQLTTTEDEFWDAFKAAHRAGELPPECDVMAEALERAEAQLAQKKK